MYSSSSASPTPEPSSERRITTKSYEYTRRFRKAHFDTDTFDGCPKLQGSLNYATWRLGYEGCLPAVGDRRLLLGTAEPPTKPAEPVSIREWNRYMLKEAWWLGSNSSIVRYIRSTILPHRQSIVEGCSLVSEALHAIEKACPPLPVNLGLHAFNQLHNYTLDHAPSFDEFTAEFERRFYAFNSLRGGFELDDNNKCMIFLRALGPRFQQWIDMTGLLATVAGFGNRGEQLTFCELRQQAGNAWCSISAKEEQARVSYKRVEARKRKREREDREWEREIQQRHDTKRKAHLQRAGHHPRC